LAFRERSCATLCTCSQPRASVDGDADLAELLSLANQLAKSDVANVVRRVLEQQVAVRSVRDTTSQLAIVAERAVQRVTTIVGALRRVGVQPTAFDDEARSAQFLYDLAKLNSSGTTGSRFSPQVRADVLAAIQVPPVPVELLMAAANVERRCVQCSLHYISVSPRYPRCCGACAATNVFFRDLVVGLDGVCVMVTGARVKIGFETVVKLLSAGAQVVATSRFPFTTARRFAEHEASNAWGTRLRVVGCDFRDVASVERLCAFLTRRLESLDVLINNAAQTIRKPAPAFKRLVEQELALAAADAPASEFERHAVAFHREFAATGAPAGGGGASSSSSSLALVPAAQELHRSALSTQVPVCSADSTARVLFGGDGWCVPEFAATTGVLVDGDGDIEAFRAGLVRSSNAADSADAVTVAAAAAALPPSGEFAVVLPGGQALVAPPTRTPASALSEAARLTRATDEPLDLRRATSWTACLEDVDAAEWLEVLTVNSAVPALLSARLLPLLTRSPLPERHVVNVSSMEGKMLRWKSSQHPHTNAAKAALNMVTRTAGMAWRRDYGVLINAVDTGWVTDERPLATQLATPQLHPASLDEIDGAVRVLQPLYRSVAERTCAAAGGDASECACWAHKLRFPNCGQFLKNFEPTLW
jgi:NAD(P)-dependent dehydrogenase (short-subunit alcohol dehydrogenase family)